MKSLIKLFKSIEIEKSKKVLKTKSNDEKKRILSKTISNGFILSEKIISNFSTEDIDIIIKEVISVFGTTSEQLNSSFHKSWTKVKDASIEQLVAEQIVHYITTYGFEALGIYDENSVYIPTEKLDIPEIKEDKFNFILINGLTKDEIREKVFNLLEAGIALKEDTVNDICDVLKHIGINQVEIGRINNKEIKTFLYDTFG